MKNKATYDDRIIEGTCFKANVSEDHYYSCFKDLCGECITQLTRWLDGKAEIVERRDQQ